MEIQLQTPIEFADKGEMTEGTFITIKAPNNLVSKYAGVIEQEFFKCMHEASKSNPESQKGDEEKELEAQDIMMMIAMLGGDFDKCLIAIEQILIRAGFLNNKLLINQAIFKKLSYHDTKMIIGGYVKAFLFTSPNA